MDVLAVADGVLLVGLYAAAARRARRWPAPRTAAFCAGVAVAVVALAAVPDATLAGHMTQHLLLALVAAPLLVAGSPVALALRATTGAPRRALARVRLGGAAAGWVALALAMIVLHLPAVYDATQARAGLHAAEHVVFLVAGALFWRPLLGLGPAPRLSVAGRPTYLLTAMAPMGAVGVAMSGAGHPWYADYPSLADQRTAGAIMWAGGGLVLTVALTGLVWTAAVTEHRRQLRLEARP